MTGTLETYFAVIINGNEFELDIVFDYLVSGEDYEFELTRCELGYGDIVFDLKESRWWHIVELKLHNSDRIIEMVDADIESVLMEVKR